MSNTLIFNLIIFCSILFACSNNSVKQYPKKIPPLAIDLKNSIEYEIFTIKDKGFGFDIIKNGKVYIHQPIVPTWQGLHPFPSYESAKLIAGLLTNRLQRNTYTFLFQKKEVDSLMKGYITVRKDTGLYDETACYPLKYTGTWEFYQECTTANCYMGAQFKILENLGNLCYSSLFDTQKNIEIKNSRGQNKSIYLFPRNFAIRTEKQPDKAIYLRLFFSKEEIEKGLQNYNIQTGNHFLLQDILVLQYNDKDAVINPYNNIFEQKKYSLI